MEKVNVKKYSNGEITIIWEPAKCEHSTICWKGKQGLPQVFNPLKKPWISIDGADSQTIMYKIDQCPSGALSYSRNMDLLDKDI
ncbi:(4Fe-4S)-binding protein [Sphingobacterium rhinopitheci]|uniref:(4Fe-4S)-binding protein n=1 Tax=Sphingobacterium rhinopitheci TaxID=2781960 RepID=UPI001F51AD6C|nr:(4Fe-4S)-binding protein [Sphingobacterium rhinopitheci]MCI0921094.1 (4Fe-4S)-binding protein [Sphingobacterium rhinopitheci]